MARSRARRGLRGGRRGRRRRGHDCCHPPSRETSRGAVSLYAGRSEASDGGSPHSVCSTAPRRRLGTRICQAQAASVRGRRAVGRSGKSGAQKNNDAALRDEAGNAPLLTRTMRLFPRPSPCDVPRRTLALIRLVSAVESAAASGRRRKREGKAIGEEMQKPDARGNRRSSGPD